MKVTIIPIDNVVGIDGISYKNIDLSWIPDYEGKTIHAVHWDDETKEGEIEFVGPAQPLQTNVFGIDGFCTFIKAISQWQEKRDQELALIEQARIQEEQMKRQLEEARQAQFLTTHLPFDPDEEEGDLPTDDVETEQEQEEDLYYDIEELLKEI